MIGEYQQYSPDYPLNYHKIISQKTKSVATDLPYNELYLHVNNLK
jgi:hypothetical protein